MRTSDICPTCSTYSNALCTLYNGTYLSTLDIQPLDSVETALAKIEAFAAASDGATPNLQAVTAVGAITTNTISLPSLQLTLDASVTPAPGELAWNADEASAELGLDASSSLTLGQEDHYQVTNSSGATILDGTPVMATGSLGASGKILIAPMDATVKGNSKYFLGIATADIANGANGKITKWGKIKNSNTSGAQYGETWADGNIIWIDNTVVGGLTNVEPIVGIKLPIAFVIRAHATTGIMAVRAISGSSISELHDVNLTGLVDGMQLVYNSTTENWEASTVVTTPSLQDVVDVDGFVTQATSGTSIWGINSSTGRLLRIDNSNFGRGLFITNSGGGYGAYIDNTATGYGLQVQNTGTSGLGVSIDNTASTGKAISIINNSTSGNGVFVTNSNSGTAVVLSATLASTGNLIQGLNDNSTTFLLDKLGNITTEGVIKAGGYTVATLPTGVTGARAYVTDATVTTFYSVVAGGGANVVPVFYNGTNWVIA